MLFDPKWKPKTDADTLDEVGQLMLKAADYLETHRWCQEDLTKRNGAVCMIGSLIKIEAGNVTNNDDINSYEHPLSYEAYHRISKYIGDSVPECWNDSHGRKKSEVISTLREAAKLTK